jgi:hypothetical protein
MGATRRVKGYEGSEGFKTCAAVLTSFLGNVHWGVISVRAPPPKFSTLLYTHATSCVSSN